MPEPTKSRRHVPVSSLSLLIILLSAGLSTVEPARGAVIWVGSACPGAASDLATAVEAAQPGDVVRLTETLVPTTTVEIGKNLTVEGGYACGANAPSGRTRINVSNVARAIYVGQLDPTPIEVTFRHLDVDGLEPWDWPDAPLPAANAGGIRIRGNVTARFENVTLRGSFQRTTGGGALAIDRKGAAEPDFLPDRETLPHVVFRDSELTRNASANASHYGGAIDCVEGSLELSRTLVAENFTESSGGAISLGGFDPATAEAVGCSLSIDDVTLADNHAAFNGGAIFSRHGGSISGFDSVFTGNRADGIGGGGGIQAIGDPETDGAYVTLGNSVFHGNHALRGGGVSLTNGELWMEGVGCPVPEGPEVPLHCSGFLANEVNGATGAALFVETTTGPESLAKLRGTTVAGHRVAATDGAVVQGIGSTMILDAVYLYGNDSDLLIKIRDAGNHSGDLGIFYTTFRNNSVDVAVVGTEEIAGSRPRVDFYNSLVFDSGGLLVSSPDAVGIHCLGTNVGTVPSGIDVFRNQTTEIFDLEESLVTVHLKEGSPAIDRCGTRYLGPSQDIDGGPRLIGDAYDAGASEYGSGGFLFADGFESGDTRAWGAGTVAHQEQARVGEDR